MSVPKLRFPEFWDEGEWEEKRLGDICSYWNGASHEGSVTENGNYYLISLNSIDIEGNLKPDMKRLTHTDNSLQKNDLIMVLSDVAHGNFLGLTDIIPDDHFVLNQRMAGLRLKDSSIGDVRFLRVHINNNQPYFKQKGQGSSQLNLSKSSVTDFPVLLPSLKEQQKIADCLSSIADRITAETQKLDTLKAHKKGLMQQLFPAEDETLPKLRFPEFRDSGEWEEEDLSKLTSCSLSNGVFNDPKKVGRGYKLINVLDMYINTSINEDNLSLVELSRDEFLKNKVENGDLFFTRSSLVKSGIAYSNIYLGNSDNITFDGHLIRFRPNKKILMPIFVNYLLRTAKVRSQLVALGKTATMTTIGQADVGSVKLSFPHISEQQKIADCLTSIDEAIAAQSQAIDLLKLHKKGLMQQLFPSVEEVRG